MGATQLTSDESLDVLNCVFWVLKALNSCKLSGELGIVGEGDKRRGAGVPQRIWDNMNVVILPNSNGAI